MSDRGRMFPYPVRLLRRLGLRRVVPLIDGLVYEAVEARSGDRVVLRLGGHEPPRTVPAGALPIRSAAGVLARNRPQYVVLSLGRLRMLRPLIDELQSPLPSLTPVLPGARLAVLAQVARSLDQLHGMGLVFGDLRPEAILVDEDDLEQPPILIDWSSSLSSGKRVARPSSEFAAPEVRAGQTATPSSDIWSLAAIARWMGFSGMPAYPSLSVARSALDGALDLDPASRPSARDLAKELEGMRQDLQRASPQVSELDDPVTIVPWIYEQAAEPEANLIRGHDVLARSTVGPRQLASFGYVALLATALMVTSAAANWSESTRYAVGATAVGAIIPALLAWQDGLLARLRQRIAGRLTHWLDQHSGLAAVHDAFRPMHSPAYDLRDRGVAGGLLGAVIATVVGVVACLFKLIG